nr:ribonuclease H-like domain-containing protein [Tanacetum cinerariifolium]
TKLSLGFKEYIRSDEVCDLSIPIVFDPEPDNREVKSLYESDKSSASETYDFASCVSSPKTNDSFSIVDVKLLPKSDVKDPSLTNDLPSCSFKENVKHPRNLLEILQHLFLLVDPFLLLVETDQHLFMLVHPHVNKDISIVDSDCSRSMTGNKDKLDDFVQVKVGTVTFEGRDGKITGRGTIRTSKLDFENVYYVEELQNFNLFSVSQICDKKNKVLLTDVECPVLTKEFKLPDETSLEESTKWHKRMVHVNFKTINKLAKHGLVDGLPLKLFTNEHNCVACNKGKQHKASYKAISAGIKRDYSNAKTPQQNGIAEQKNKTIIEAARFMLVDSKLPTMFWTKAISTACYVLNRVSITNPHNKTPYELLSGKVPNIRHLKPFGCQVTILNTSDHLGKFERKANDGFLVGYAAHSKAYRVYNLTSKKVKETLNLRYLEDKPNVQGLGQEWYFDLDYLTDSLGYQRFKTNPPAGTHDTNILVGTQADDSESECDEQVILVPSFPSNSFLGPSVHDVSAPMKNNLDYAEELARLQRQEYEAHSAAAKHGFEFFVDSAALLPQATIEIHKNLVPAAGDPAGSLGSTGGVPAGSVPASGVPAGSVPASGVPTGSVPARSVPTGRVPAGSIISTGGVPAGSVPASSVPAGGVLAGSIVSAEFGAPADSAYVHAVFTTTPVDTSPLPPGYLLGSCEQSTRFPSPSGLGNHQPTAGIFSSSSYDDDFCADVTNLASNVDVDPVATKTNHDDHLHCLFAYFLSQLEPSSVAKAFEDPDWVAAMQVEMQRFYNQQVWKLVPLPDGKIAIGTKWILKNKRDARGIVVRNKARLVAQGHRKEEGIDYDEVFTSVARIEAIRLFLAFASYMGFMVYQMDVKSAFLYEEIKEEAYVTQPKGFEDPHSSTMEVSPVATRQINTIHPQSLIIGDPTSAV